MSARLILTLALVLAGGATHGVGEEEGRAPDRPQPFFEVRSQSAEYAGPGRDEPEPAGIEEVRIGYFGPDDPNHPLGGDMWLAATIAIEEANREGGYRGKPFRLVPAWSDDPWGTGVADLARAVYADRVWAVIGSIDGSSTHLAEQVVAKARLTLISPASTDETVNMANVAWMFSCLPADGVLARALAPAIADRVGSEPFVILSATDHDSHHALSEVRAQLIQAGVSPRYSLEFEPGSTDYSSILETVTASAAEAVVVIAGPVDSARAVSALRTLGADLAIFGSHSMGRRSFLDAAGTDADGVVFPLPCDPAFVESDFAARFIEQTGHRPDCTTVQTYDAMRMTIEAIRQAGLNRARIRDAMAELSPWDGAAGAIRWDSLGQNRREVSTVTAEEIVIAR